jgi:hypothetical protein
VNPSERIAIFCHDTPFPAVHGGRVDMWNRILALRQLRVPLLVAYWTKGEDTREARDALRAIDCEPLELRRKIGVVGLTWRYPRRLLSFDVLGAERARVLNIASTFRPSFILLDGWEPYLTARQTARTLSVPLVYRSHNVEHRYWAKQLAYASWRNKGRFLATVPWLRKLEREIRYEADAILDISDDDRTWWARTDLALADRVLPPTWTQTRGPTKDVVSDASPKIDALFIGNLYSPNNVEAVEWLCRLVMPKLRAMNAGSTVCVAGSRPSAQLMTTCRSAGIEVIADPPDVRPLVLRSRSLVNPARFGSGLQLKMLSMLDTPLPVISTHEGAYGLPPQLSGHCTIAQTPEKFAEAIVAAPRSHVDLAARRAALDACCGPERLRAVLKDLSTVSTRGTPAK